MKQKLKGALEYDLIYGKDAYCYLQNNPKLVKWIKRRMNKRLRREKILFDDDLLHICGDCGKPLTLVRPGKHQCDNPKCVQNKRNAQIIEQNEHIS